MERNKIHIRHCILFMFDLGKNPTEAQQWICRAYGEQTISVSSVKEWFGKFRKGQFELEDKVRCGRPRQTKDDRLAQLLSKDPALSTRRLAKILEVNQSTVLRRLRAMGKVQRSGRWENRERGPSFDAATGVVVKQICATDSQKKPDLT